MAWTQQHEHWLQQWSTPDRMLLFLSFNSLFFCRLNASFFLTMTCKRIKAKSIWAALTLSTCSVPIHTCVRYIISIIIICTLITFVGYFSYHFRIHLTYHSVDHTKKARTAYSIKEHQAQSLATTYYVQFKISTCMDTIFKDTWTNLHDSKLLLLQMPNPISKWCIPSLIDYPKLYEQNSCPKIRHPTRKL